MDFLNIFLSWNDGLYDDLLRGVAILGNTRIYRGKRKDDGAWVFGWYCEYPFGRCPLKSAIIPASDAIEGYHHFVEIDPDTIGQFTGLLDKTGKEIYEGDVLSGMFLFSMPIDGVVAFRDGAFGLLIHRGEAEDFTAFTSICNIEWEVIGNITDNDIGGYNETNKND